MGDAAQQWAPVLDLLLKQGKHTTALELVQELCEEAAPGPRDPKLEATLQHAVSVLQRVVDANDEDTEAYTALVDGKWSWDQITSCAALRHALHASQEEVLALRERLDATHARAFAGACHSSDPLSTGAPLTAMERDFLDMLVMHYLKARGLAISAVCMAEELGPEFIRLLPTSSETLVGLLRAKKGIGMATAPATAPAPAPCRVPVPPVRVWSNEAVVSIESTMVPRAPLAVTASFPTLALVTELLSSLPTVVRNTVTAKRLQLLPLLQTALTGTSRPEDGTRALAAFASVLPLPATAEALATIMHAILVVCMARGPSWVHAHVLPWVQHTCATPIEAAWKRDVPVAIALAGALLGCSVGGQPLIDPDTVEALRDTVAHHVVVDHLLCSLQGRLAAEACVDSVTRVHDTVHWPPAASRLLLAVVHEVAMGLVLWRAQSAMGTTGATAAADTSLSVSWLGTVVQPRLGAWAAREGIFWSLVVRGNLAVLEDVTSAAMSSRGDSQTKSHSEDSPGRAPVLRRGPVAPEWASKWAAAAFALQCLVPCMGQVLRAEVARFRAAGTDEAATVAAACGCVRAGDLCDALLVQAVYATTTTSVEGFLVLHDKVLPAVMDILRCVDCRAAITRPVVDCLVHIVQELCRALGTAFAVHVALPLWRVRMGLPVAALSECASPAASAMPAAEVPASATERHALLHVLALGILHGPAFPPALRRRVIKCIAAHPAYAACVPHAVAERLPPDVAAAEWLDVLALQPAAVPVVCRGLLCLPRCPSALVMQRTLVAFLDITITSDAAGADAHWGIACRAAAVLVCTATPTVQDPLKQALRTRLSGGPTAGVRAVVAAMAHAAHAVDVMTADLAEFCLEGMQTVAAAMGAAVQAGNRDMAAISSHLASASNVHDAQLALATTRQAAVELLPPWRGARFEDLEPVAMDMCCCLAAIKAAAVLPPTCTQPDHLVGTLLTSGVLHTPALVQQTRDMFSDLLASTASTSAPASAPASAPHHNLQQWVAGSSGGAATTGKRLLAQAKTAMGMAAYLRK